MDEPFPEWMETILPLLIFGPVIGLSLLYWWSTGRTGVLERTFGDEDFTFTFDSDGEVRVHTRTGRPTSVHEVAHERRSRGRTYFERHWRVEVSGVALGNRTTLAVGLDGLTGAMRNQRSFKDVVVGDGSFDRTFKVGGSDADVIRGVFAHEDVKAAVRAVFGAMTVRDCVLDGELLAVEFHPDHVRRQTARERVELVRRLADVLDNASASLALKEAAVPMGSVSSSSGSSVGVRIL